MKSIKPGRGPSKLNMVSAIGAAVDYFDTG